jgi:cytochrome c biogenesis protein CcdA
LALALTAGMVSTVNPCGFAMLPAYLAWFVSDDSDVHLDLAQRLRRALGVIVSVAIGFMIVFTLVGLLMEAGVRIFMRYVPWAALVIGAGLVVVGVAMLAGSRVGGCRSPIVADRLTVDIGRWSVSA